MASLPLEGVRPRLVVERGPTRGEYAARSLGAMVRQPCTAWIRRAAAEPHRPQHAGADGAQVSPEGFGSVGVTEGVHAEEHDATL